MLILKKIMLTEVYKTIGMKSMYENIFKSIIPFQKNKINIWEILTKKVIKTKPLIFDNEINNFLYASIIKKVKHKNMKELT